MLTGKHQKLINCYSITNVDKFLCWKLYFSCEIHIKKLDFKLAVFIELIFSQQFLIHIDNYTYIFIDNYFKGDNFCFGD